MANGLKRREIKPCAGCGKGLAEGGLIVYRVQVERFLLDPRAIQRQAGLEMQIGAVLGSIMGPDEDLAVGVDTDSALVCGNCVIRFPAIVLMPEAADEPAPANERTG